MLPIRISLILSLLVWSNRAVCQSPEPPQAVLNQIKKQGLDGVVLIARQGKIVSLTATGVADRAARTNILKTSKFKIASLTKTFTAALILQLVEEGRISLQDKISKHLSGYSGDAGDSVNLFQLLTYSSGIPNCENDLGMQVYQTPLSVDTFISRYCSGKLQSRPGSAFSYNNGDYILLGRIIEKVTGQPFSDVLRLRILQPLGMINSGMLTHADIVAGLVPSYLYNDSLKIFSNDDPYFIENFFSAGAMYSTVEDLYRFDQALFNYKLLKKETVELMIKPVPELGNVGLGFWYTTGFGNMNEPFAYRPGGILGSSANWVHLLGGNETYILLSNTNAANLFNETQELYGLLHAPANKSKK